MNLNEMIARHPLRMPDDEGAGAVESVTTPGADKAMSLDEMADTFGIDKDGADKTEDDASKADTKADDAPKSDAKAEDTTETKDDPDAAKGDKTGAESESDGFKLTVPPEAGLQQEAVTAFEQHAASWMKDNPEATHQELLQMGLDYQAKLHADALSTQIAAAEQTATGWVETIKSDPKYGGDNFDKNAAIAEKAVTTFGGDELKNILNETGLGNHPALFKAFVEAGKGLVEPEVVRGDPAPAGSATEDAAETLYG